MVIVVEEGQDKVNKELIESQSDNIAQLSEISRNSRTTFFTIILATAYSYLTISNTNDAALLSNSSATPLPIIHVNVPIVWFYYFAPIILTVLFVYFHLYLERFWRCVTCLPLRHPDGRGLDDYIYPWLISSAFIRGEIPELRDNRFSLSLDSLFSILLGWWLIPIVLYFYWARYLVAHDWVGTILHVILILISTGFAFRFFFYAKNAMQLVKLREEVRIPLKLNNYQRIIGLTSLIALMFGLSYLSLSAFYGSPVEQCEKMYIETNCRYYSAGNTVLDILFIDPYADVKEEILVDKPENWRALTGKPSEFSHYLASINGINLDGRNLRHLNAERSFLPATKLKGSSLEHAVLRYAVLSGSEFINVSFNGADLSNTYMVSTKITRSDFKEVTADHVKFDFSEFVECESDKGCIFSGEFYDASFKNVTGDKLVFENANLREANFNDVKIHFSSFRKVDFSSAKIKESELTNNNFIDTEFTQTVLTDTDFSYSTFEDCNFIKATANYIQLEGVTFLDSEFDNSETIIASTDNQDASIKYIKPKHAIDGIYAFGSTFEGGKISNTHFSDSNFISSQFNNVQFNNTLFENSDFSNSTFSGIDFTGLEFIDSDFSGAKLETITGLTPLHLGNMCGNEKTSLPPGLKIKPCR